MKLIRSITILFFILFSGGIFQAFAQSEDAKIIISDKEEIYTYTINNKGNAQVDVSYIVNYQCLRSGTASFVDYYDNYIEIKDVKIKGLKGISPKYGMYKQENVFFSDSKACYFDLPFIKKDSEATVSVRKVYKDIRRLNFITLAEPYYVRSKKISIIIPDQMKVAASLKNASGNISKDSIRNEADKTTTIRFQINNQTEVVNEPYSTGYRHVYPYLIIVPKESDSDGKKTKYFETVKDLYQWYREPLLSLNPDEKVIKEKSDQLTAHCNSDEDRIRELCKWVQQNIRYIAFMDGIAAFRPDDAGEVLHKKYGDCKGMSNLLKALLISAGFDARLTWVATRMDGNENLDVNIPIPFADHMICSLFWNDSIYFIDPTVKSLSFGEIPEFIQGRKALIEDGENYIIATIPEYGSVNNLDKLFVQYHMEENKLIGKGQRCFKGESKHSIVYWLNTLKESDKKIKIEEFLKNDESQDSISEISTEGLDSFFPEVCVNYKAVRKSNITVFDNYIYINPDIDKDYQNAKINIATRKTGMQFPYRDHVLRISEFFISDTYQIIQLPPETEVIRDKYSFLLSFRQEGNKIIYRKELSFLDSILEKEDFEQWNADIDRLRSAYNELIVLEKQN